MGGLVKGLGLAGLCITALIIMKLVADSYQSATPTVQKTDEATQQVEDAAQKAQDAANQLEKLDAPSPELPE